MICVVEYISSKPWRALAIAFLVSYLRWFGSMTLAKITLIKLLIDVGLCFVLQNLGSAEDIKT